MEKKLPAAITPLPKFRSDKEAAEYFETHSVAERVGSVTQKQAGKSIGSAYRVAAGAPCRRKVAYFDTACTRTDCGG